MSTAIPRLIIEPDGFKLLGQPVTMSSSSPSRSSEIRRDAIFDHWVVFSPARARRPSDFKSHSPASNPNPNPNSNPTPSCPFCIGRESECAPEIFRLPAGCGAAWKIRVIENLYPALRRDAEPLVPGDTAGAAGPVKLSLPGFGFHDVVIETPYHSVRLPDLPPQEVGEVLLTYKERILQLKRHASIKYVQVFKNHGASAGASMSHSHSQIMGVPLIPPTVAARLSSTKEWFERTGKCCLCEVWSEEILINETVHFFAIVPFAASYPFEIWILPRDHSSHFHDIDSEKAADLGSLLKLMLRKLSKQLNDPPYNFMIHTAPLELSPSCLPYMHWFLQIVPQLNRLAGFEMASGCFINPVFPEDAAKVLKEVDCSI